MGTRSFLRHGGSPESRRHPVFGRPRGPFWTGGAPVMTGCSSCHQRLPFSDPAGALLRMNLPHEVEILLVEDNAHDEELTLRALKERNIANQVFVARDGAEALDFFFGDGSHPWHEIGIVPLARDRDRAARGPARLEAPQGGRPRGAAAAQGR